MFNGAFKNIVGTMADTYFQQVGIHVNLIRYDGTLIKPNPIVANKGVQTNTDGTEFQLFQSEQVQTYTTSIPEDSLIASLGGDWTEALLPDARWQVSEDGGTTWVNVRLVGTPQKARYGRYGFTLVAEGIGEGATY